MSPTFTTDPALKLGAVRAAIATAIGSIDDLTVIPNMNVGPEMPLPSATVYTGRLRRAGLEQAEHQLPKDDWFMTHWISVFVRLTDSATADAEMDGLVGSVIAAIDFDWQLDGEVREARAVEAVIEPTDPADSRPRLLVGVIEVQSLALMPR